MITLGSSKTTFGSSNLNKLKGEKNCYDSSGTIQAILSKYYLLLKLAGLYHCGSDTMKVKWFYHYFPLPLSWNVYNLNWNIRNTTIIIIVRSNNMFSQLQIHVLALKLMCMVDGQLANVKVNEKCHSRFIECVALENLEKFFFLLFIY